MGKYLEKVRHKRENKQNKYKNRNTYMEGTAHCDS
jgi:hypothetical protein